MFWHNSANLHMGQKTKKTLISIHMQGSPATLTYFNTGGAAVHDTLTTKGGKSFYCFITPKAFDKLTPYRN